ncbi:MAG: glutamyl-tRNA reductase, partial [Actinomycetota bacterium]|nr:glutamyl-tRNA reductase [Actinomycetota bacterium]
VRVVSLGDLGERLAAQSSTTTLPEVQAVCDLVTAEVAGYLTERMAKAVGPTVAALRSRAAELVEVEMARLDQKLPGLDPETRAEMQRTVHRVVEKLLHTPTVRIKRLSGEGDGGDYAAVLRDLFDLDPHDVAAVSVPPDPAVLPGAERGGPA